MQLGQLAREYRRPFVTEGHAEIVEARRHSTTGFVEDQGSRLTRKHLQPGTPCRRSCWQEALENKTVGWQAGYGESADGGAGTGRRHDIDPGATRLAHQPEAGVTDQWCPGITNQGDTATVFQFFDQTADSATLIVLMERNQASSDAIASEQPSTVAGIFRSDQIDIGENLECPLADVGQVADRRRHHIEYAGLI